MLPEKVAALGDAASVDTLNTLASIVRGTPRIRGRYARKIRKGRMCAPWYYLSGAKSSYQAARFFTDNGSANNLVAIVKANLATIADIEWFLNRTPLTECNRGRVENALRRLQEDLPEVKATEAAAQSGGDTTRGELRRMTSGYAPAAPSGDHWFAQGRP